MVRSTHICIHSFLVLFIQLSILRLISVLRLSAVFQPFHEISENVQNFNFIHVQCWTFLFSFKAMKGSIWLVLMATCMVLKHTHSICKFSLCFNYLWHDKCSQTKCRLCKKYQAMYLVACRAFSGWQRRISIYHDANILDFYNHKSARASANLTLLPCQTFENIVIHFLCI